MQASIPDSTDEAAPVERVAFKQIPLPRRCIATRQRQHRNGMLRFVLDPDNNVVPDLAEKLPGRGMWVCADRRTLETAVSKNLFARAARAPAVVPSQLVETVTELLRQRCMGWLGQTRGAGGLKLGYFQVREALAGGQVAFLIEASDGTENGRSKVMGQAGDLPVITCFTRAELGEALGRSQAVHLAGSPGKIGARFLEEARRYTGILGLNHPQSVGEQ
ncbi:MAG: RNA-binding protein [Alphaproteobacteria bacterium]